MIWSRPFSTDLVSPSPFSTRIWQQLKVFWTCVLLVSQLPLNKPKLTILLESRFLPYSKRILTIACTSYALRRDEGGLPEYAKKTNRFKVKVSMITQSFNRIHPITRRKYCRLLYRVSSISSNSSIYPFRTCLDFLLHCPDKLYGTF